MSAPRRPVDPRAGVRDGASGAPRPGATGVSRTGAAGAARTGATGAARTGGGARPVTPARGTRSAATPSRGVPRATSRPGATRPGNRAPSTPPRGTARAERTRVEPPRLFSVRAIVLGCVLVLAFVLVYPTLHTYLRQEADLRELRGQVADARERNEDLEAELERWDDPAFVAAQARERLSYVLPGEKAYRVVDPETVEDPTAEVVVRDAPVAGTPEEQPWYTSVWDSLVVAGETDDDGDPATAEDAKDAKQKDTKQKDAKKDPAGKGSAEPSSSAKP
ncbi:FtsB family cell division protein [Cellulomonas palmilytica]|uniref:FtsB family cell division protein n=1 Tax=Cellulomonas palmilytica TaxID=2608402 RepID=UPI001F33B232|nr:septum formation initiator family protein [Cellulomonas palmilytica]UJP41161.1 septum formation initiator family protein [Cellulomonas palmilytica]